MTARADRTAVTRERILVAAERLFAEHGVHATSNRQVGEAAGQGNTAVVGYHFGTKADLVRAIALRHSVPIDAIRARMVAEIGDSTDPRAWLACLVRPTAEHLDRLGAPTWFARFGAQIMADPAMREIMVDESRSSPTMQDVLDGLHRCLPALPPEVRLERGDVSRLLLTGVFTERERALAEGTPTPRATWRDAAGGLIDVLVGVWTAPVTPA